MRVVWNGRDSLHKLFTSERDQLLYQSRGWALKDHGLADWTRVPEDKRRIAPRRGVNADCVGCRGPLDDVSIDRGQVRCEACHAKWRDTLTTERAQLFQSIVERRRDGMGIRAIARELQTSIRMVYRCLEAHEADTSWPKAE